MLHYIIDGHNVIHHLKRYSILLNRDYRLTLQTFYHDILEYAEAKQVRITVVFDGSPAIHIQRKTKRVTLLFSGENTKADTIILSEAETDHGPHTIVVTADNFIKREALCFRCKILSPTQFERIFSSTDKTRMPSREEPEAKPVISSRREIKEWLELFRKNSRKK